MNSVVTAANSVDAEGLAGRDIVVIGASAGGLQTLQTLVSGLPSDFPGTIFIVVHFAPDVRSMLDVILARTSPLPVSMPEDMTRFERGRIYVSTPDCHLLVEAEHVRVVRRPKENRHRPAIDPLFRSAAWSHGPRVVGVVLTGRLDDGAAGLWAIRTCGGVAVVQDPADALHPDMPENALAMTEVDHCLPAAGIAPLLDRLARTPIRAAPRSVPPAIGAEVDFVRLDGTRDMADLARIGRLSPFTCPSCRGALFEMEDGDLLRFRCHTGHAFAGQSLVDEQTRAIEDGLYAALRAVEEKAEMLRRLGARSSTHFPELQQRYAARAAEMERSAGVLRQLLAEGAL